MKVEIVRKFKGFVEIKPKTKHYCFCGRSLNFPAEVRGNILKCRCGKLNPLNKKN